MKLTIPAAAIALCALLAVRAASSEEGREALRAGAARIDYTPRGAQLPRNYIGVLDPIFVRGVVLDNGRTRAALVAIDAGAMPTELYNKVSARAAKELNIPPNQLLMSATHTHSVPFRLDDSAEETILRACERLRPGCSRRAWPGARACRTST